MFRCLFNSKKTPCSPSEQGGTREMQRDNSFAKTLKVFGYSIQRQVLRQFQDIVHHVLVNE